ncbi:MAG: hypothetical protein R3B93_20970 [Bacteroidia bacterium]
MPIASIDDRLHDNDVFGPVFVETVKRIKKMGNHLEVQELTSMVVSSMRSLRHDDDFHRSKNTLKTINEHTQRQSLPGTIMISPPSSGVLAG